MAEERDIISSLQFPLALTLHCPSFPRELTLSALGEGVLLEFSWGGASLLAGNTLQLGSGEDLVRAHCLVRLRPATEQGLAKLVCVGNRAWNQTPACPGALSSWEAGSSFFSFHRAPSTGPWRI